MALLSASGGASEADRGAQRGPKLVAALLTVFLVFLLATLFLVAVWTARGAAQRVTCTNHLRQLAAALAMYRDDCGGYPPSSYEVAGGPGRPTERVTWQRILLPYVSDPAIFVCPSDPAGTPASDGRPDQLATTRYRCSYVYLGDERDAGATLARSRAPSAPAGERRQRARPARRRALLVCRHHDESEADSQRWVLAAYEDGSVKWESMRSSPLRRREDDSRGVERVPRSGRNDW